MPDPKSNPSVKPGTPGKAAPEESESMRQMDRDADEMAKKGRKEEEKYDEDEGIFDKI